MLSHWGGRKTKNISCFRFGSCMCRSGFGERIFTVYALYIRKWSTVLQHRTMVSTCRTHWLILGCWHLLNLRVFSQWKLRFPREKLTQFPSPGARPTKHRIGLIRSNLVSNSIEIPFPVPLSNSIARSRHQSMVTLGPVSIYEKTSFRKISWSLEATRSVL